MADAYKILFRGDLSNTTTAPAIYTPNTAGAHFAIIKNIVIWNHGANTEIVSLFFDANTANGQWGSTKKLAPTGADGSSMEWDGTFSLANTDTIYANTTDSTAVSIVISGDEVS